MDHRLKPGDDDLTVPADANLTGSFCIRAQPA